jgi:hypothetical protein
MTSRYAEYKKRRLIKLQQRILELEGMLKELEDKVAKLYHENIDLKSQLYYYQTHPRR